MGTASEIFPFALYIIAFILSVLIEGAVNWVFLRKNYRVGQIMRSTFGANTSSYIFAPFIMYGYGFDVLKMNSTFTTETKRLCFVCMKQG